MSFQYRFTYGSTFAGCGGSSLGYKLAGGKGLFAIEFDKNAAETYKLNFPDAKVLCRDIAAVNAEELEYVDILDGSPPCQGFSTAGKRIVTDPRNSLFKEFVRLIDGLQPKVFVMENVSGMIKGKMKPVFRNIMQSLKGTGYNVKCQLMNAMYFNVPQSRQRLIWIGIRPDLGIEPTFPKAQSRPIALRTICPDVIASRSQNINAWISSQRPLCTLTKTPYKQLLKISNGTREPTLKELKMISSFPDDFQFIGNKQKAWERMGNSVPPLFMKAIAEHIRDYIL